MADAKMTILSLIWSKSAKFHVFQKYTFRKYIIDALYTKKSIFTPSGTVFSKFIALELLSETLRNKWCHNDVISRHSDITVSVLVRISPYTILYKLGGHSGSSFKVTWGGGFWNPPPASQKVEKSPVWIGLIEELQKDNIRFVEENLTMKWLQQSQD